MVNNFEQSENGQQKDNTDGADRNPSSLTRRLTQILMEEGEDDLLLQRSDGEDGVLQWLRALDMQVMGACRADERLKPFLKLNVSSGVAEDPLLSYLSQHFEPSEVGMLARCLCIPLVSIRVGKIIKQGTLLSPISTRGNLCLTLLPTSDLRISFNGDDGSIERLATLSTKSSHCSIKIEEISADKSGSSFLIKTFDNVVSYYWCSEKSKLLGDELLIKMKDFLVRKPSLTEITGISESRLSFFASHLRAHCSGTFLTSAQASGVLVATFSLDDSVGSSQRHFPQSSLNCQKGSKTNLTYQGSLSPRSSSFKEGLPKSLSYVRSAAKGKMGRRGESCIPPIHSLSTVPLNCVKPSSSDCFKKDKISEANESLTFTAPNFLDVSRKSVELPLSGPEKQVPSTAPSHFSPHYCWCPPVASALQYTLSNSKLPNLPAESLSLPPLSSLLASKSSLNLTDLPPLKFPGLLSDPLVRLPTIPSSQQIPTFTPLICDPIIHVPVIDVCSSGRGYLVSVGPAMSTVIPPLNPNLVDSLLANPESMAEKSARETLRMLISGSSNQPNQNQFVMLPSFLSSNNDVQNMLVAGSRGLYSGTKDDDAISYTGSMLLSGKSMGIGSVEIFTSRNDTSDTKEKEFSSGPSSSDAWVD